MFIYKTKQSLYFFWVQTYVAMAQLVEQADQVPKIAGSIPARCTYFSEKTSHRNISGQTLFGTEKVQDNGWK